MNNYVRLRVNFCLETISTEASVSGVKIVKHFMETRVGVVSGGGARCVALFGAEHCISGQACGQFSASSSTGFRFYGPLNIPE